jgi:DNA invertase Pin-like site-specific DNA recombinase
VIHRIESSHKRPFLHHVKDADHATVRSSHKYVAKSVVTGYDEHMSNRLIGYARVSTDDQTTRQQIDELKAAGCEEIFEDVISDTLVVVALDRLGRSTAHVIATVEKLGARGVGFKSLREPMFDTTSPTGEFLLTVFAGLAQLERRMISQRTKSALAAKKTRGETLGRPVALTPSQIKAAQKMIADGEGASHVARLFKVDRATLYRALRKAA